MQKVFTGNTNDLPDLDVFFQDFILPEFGIEQPVVWERHIQTDPDNFLHTFTVGDVKYALAFDDYPSGFSVERDDSVKSMKLSNGEEVLNISSPFDKYAENITGAFMLFQVIDQEAFNVLLNYLEASYRKLRKKWQSDQNSLVVIARDVLQLAETASENHDMGALYSLLNIVETFNGLEVEDNTVEIGLLKEYVEILLDTEFDDECFTPEDKDSVRDGIYKTLSIEVQDLLDIQKYEAKALGRTIRLVTAMYSRVKADVTEGISARVLFDGNEISYPSHHFIDDELKKYFAENTYIGKDSIEQNMPQTLGDYRLVAGSVQIHDIFPRELDYISY